MTKMLETVKRIVQDVKELLRIPFQTNLQEAQEKLNNYLKSKQFEGLIQSLRDDGINVKLLSSYEGIDSDDVGNQLYVSKPRNSPELLDYFFIACEEKVKAVVLKEVVAISCFLKENPGYAEYIEKKAMIRQELLEIENLIERSHQILIFNNQLDIEKLINLTINFNRKWGKCLPLFLTLKVEGNDVRVNFSYSEIKIGGVRFLKIGKSTGSYLVNINKASIPDVLSIHVSPEIELSVIKKTHCDPILLTDKEHTITLRRLFEENPKAQEAIKVPKERPSQCGFFSTVGAATAAVVLLTAVGTLEAGMSCLRNDR